jgi:monofunctional glycosyltransferase
MAKNTFRTPTKTAKEKPKIIAPDQPTFTNKLKRWALKAILYFFVISVGSVILFKFVPIPFTPLMAARKIEAFTGGKNSIVYYEWKSLDEISKEAGLAVVSSEDQMFPDHSGFDFSAMQDAFSHNLKGKKIHGASTISQQVAKNVFLWQARSYVRKAIEVYFTALIELIWGKERILEVYLNVAEMGDMTFGVEAASKRFYGKTSANLSREQAARIAAVLPSPRRFSIARPSGYVQKRSAQIARQMRALGGVSYVNNL